MLPFIPFVAVAIGGAYAAEKIGDWLSDDDAQSGGIGAGQIVTVLAVLGAVWIMQKGK